MTKRICLRGALVSYLANSFHTIEPPLRYQFSTYVLRATESNTGNTRDAGKVQLLEGLAGLLLVTGVDYSSRTSGQVALLLLNVGLIAAVVLLDGGLRLGVVVGKLFDSGVGHFV